jgi:hypothetical protein
VRQKIRKIVTLVKTWQIGTLATKKIKNKKTEKEQ